MARREVPNSMKILDGKKLSKKILKKLSVKVRGLAEPLQLAVIFIGSGSASLAYINQKRKTCERVGIGFRLYHLAGNISQEILEKEIEKIVQDPKNSGIIVQLPLPGHLDPQKTLNLIPPEKDVDVLSEESQKSLSILSPTVGGIVRVFKEYKIKVKGKIVAVVGKGKLVGKPMIAWLEREGAVILPLDKSTKDISSEIQKADIIISGTGTPGLIKGNMIKKGAVVIDAGTAVEGGEVLGDVDFESVSKKASHITPVPGGVGPMTVAMLLVNLVELNNGPSFIPKN